MNQHQDFDDIMLLPCALNQVSRYSETQTNDKYQNNKKGGGRAFCGPHADRASERDDLFIRGLLGSFGLPIEWKYGDNQPGEYGRAEHQR